MKRDMDLVRKILLAIEASERPLDSTLIRIGGYTHDNLTEHMRGHNKDYASRRGLLALVSRRRKLLDYLRRVTPQKYTEIIGKLGIRK